MSTSDRMKQNSLTGPMRPDIRVISHTTNPIGTLFCIWTDTRYPEILRPDTIQSLYDYDGDLADTKVAKLICSWYPEYAGEYLKDYKNVILSIARKVIESNVPVGEAVTLNIVIDNASVAWREQLVRGRISQQFWTMSTRIMDLTTMDVNMNDSVSLIGGKEAVRIYNDTVEAIRSAYKKLTDLGVPMEDIRLQPQNHVHRVNWMVPLRTLVTIMNKRCDWIAQSSLWSPIVSGIMRELRRIGLEEIIAPYIGKPLVDVARDDKGKVYVSNYIMNADNEDRYSGRDKIPCDPLWLAYKGYSMPSHTDIAFYDYLKSLYIQLWSADYLEVLGWDRSNPTKLGPYDRPREEQ